VKSERWKVKGGNVKALFLRGLPDFAAKRLYRTAQGFSP
jgi:hypothetical protein